MKHSYVTAALCASFAVGLGFISNAGAADTTTNQSGTGAQAVDGQSKIAEATGKLERVFADQFVRGQIDRDALAQPITEVIQAMPEAARPKVREHIDQVIGEGEKLASQMSAEDRAKAAAAPSQDKIGHLEWGLVNAWGWPYAYGWGGLGAFGFPGMYYYGYPGFYGAGYGTGYYGGYGGYGAYGGCGYGVCGGLGLGGWYW